MLIKINRIYLLFFLSLFVFSGKAFSFQSYYNEDIYYNMFTIPDNLYLYFGGKIKKDKPIIKKTDESILVGSTAVATTLYNVHTKESLVVFRELSYENFEIREFFRCRGFAVEIDMEPALVKSIISAARHFKESRVEIISGFRSPKFNDTLSKKGRRVASESLHTLGQAIDFRFESTDAGTLGRWFRRNFEGGVGIYPTNNFVHIDSGTKRGWWGK